MVNLFLRNISLQERQERIRICRPRSDMASISGIGGCGGRSGNGFGLIVLGEFRSEVGGEGGSLGWSGSGELFYGTDMVICSLRGGGYKGRE